MLTEQFLRSYTVEAALFGPVPIETHIRLASMRQIHGAIERLERGDYECAIYVGGFVDQGWDGHWGAREGSFKFVGLERRMNVQSFSTAITSSPNCRQERAVLPRSDHGEADDAGPVIQDALRSGVLKVACPSRLTLITVDIPRLPAALRAKARPDHTQRRDPVIHG